MLCEKCNKQDVEYSSPANWWVERIGITDEKEKQEYIEQILKEIYK